MGAASSAASGPPSSATFHADGASAQKPRAPVCGAAGSGGQQADAAPLERWCWRGGGLKAKAEEQWARRGRRGATRAAGGR